MHSTKECPCEDLFPHLSKINQEERMQSLSVKSLQQTALVTEYGHVTQLKQFGDRIWSCDTAQTVWWQNMAMWHSSNSLVTEYGHVTQLSSVTEYGQGHSSVWWQNMAMWHCSKFPLPTIWLPSPQSQLCPQWKLRRVIIVSSIFKVWWSRLKLVSCSSSTYKVQWGQLWVISHLPVDPKCHLLSLHVLQYVWPAQLHKPGLIRKIECIY